MRIRLAVVVALLLAAPTARAQDLPVMFDHLAGDLALNNLLFDNTTGRIAAPATGKATTSKAPAASLAYTPTAALRASTVRGYVSRLQAKDPAAAQAVATNFSQYDYDQIYHGIAAGTGLRENDAADALAGFLILGWMIVNNVQDDKAITVPMARGVRAQVAPRLAASAQARGHAAELGEELKLLTVVVQGGWQAAVKEGKLPAYRQGIAKLFKNQYGLDMSLVNITSQGFAKK